MRVFAEKNAAFESLHDRIATTVDLFLETPRIRFLEGHQNKQPMSRWILKDPKNTQWMNSPFAQVLA